MGIKDSSLWAREILSFLETAKNGSINGTAEANAMKQSNLSRTLKSLEEKLKCQLLERGYNGVLGDPEPFRGRRTAQVGAFEQFGAGLFFQIIDYNAEIRGFHVVFFSGTADGFTADYFMKVKNSAD